MRDMSGAPAAVARPADAGEHRQQPLGLGRAAGRAGDDHVRVAGELLEALVARPAAVVVDRHGQSMPRGRRAPPSALRRAAPRACRFAPWRPTPAGPAAPTSPRASRRRALTARVLVVLAAVFMVLALVAGYARRTAVDSDQFANRATAALRDDSVRTLVAERVTDEVVLPTQADLLAARPLIESAVSGVVGGARVHEPVPARPSATCTARSSTATRTRSR